MSALRAALGGWRQRLAQGEVGPLPAVLGLLAIAGFFQLASGGVFLAPFNLVNLTLQMAAGGTLAVGVVLVLLLGEIDLSAGAVSGLAAAVAAVLSVQHGVSGPLALALGLLAAAAIGALQGLWITRLAIPSFVVTLAGLIGWQGALLWVLGRTGSVNLRDPFLTALAGSFFRGAAAYAWAALFLVCVAGGPLLEQRRRRAAGLPALPPALAVLRAGAIAALTLGAVALLDADRGVSSGLLFLVWAVVAVDFALRRTRAGRRVYAIGGSAEAARRAGIPVERVRVAVFALASLFAGWGGVLGASRLLAVNQSAGQGDVLLSAIAAAVIGGTSLFGGRGTVWAALLGTLLLQSISNGMDLLSLSASIKFMVTAGVLLATVTLDAALRRRRGAPAR